MGTAGLRPTVDQALTWGTVLGYVGKSSAWQKGVLMLGVMILVNQATNLGATTFFALSGMAHSVERFVLFQVLGGLFGLGINLSYAGLVRYSSVETAAGIGIGLAFVSVQVFSSYLFFHTAFTPWQWLGVGLILAGILLIAFGRA